MTSFLKPTQLVVHLTPSQWLAQQRKLRAALARQSELVFAGGMRVADRSVIVDRARGRLFRPTGRLPTAATGAT